MEGERDVDDQLYEAADGHAGHVPCTTRVSQMTAEELLHCVDEPEKRATWYMGHGPSEQAGSVALAQKD